MVAIERREQEKIFNLFSPVDCLNSESGPECALCDTGSSPSITVSV